MLNWTYVGGAKGLPILRPTEIPLFDNYTQWLFFVMAVIAVVAVATARYIQSSRGSAAGLRAIRDNEGAAECSGVPTLKLKLFAATVSGALMGAAGAPYALLGSFIEPTSAFSLNHAVNALAMPIIGGTAHWIGPGDRRGAARHRAAGGDGDDLVRTERARRRGDAGGIRGCRARGDSGPVQEILFPKKMNHLLQVQDLSKQFGGFTALDGVEHRHRARASASA